MKINSLNSIGAYPISIREKKDGSFARHLVEAESNAESADEQNQNQRQDSQEKPDPQKIDDAVEAFQVDAQAQENGLKATVTGNGPGLKVVLKDGQGAIVRQFTGEEFLRLRESVSKDDRICGKILDQKL